MPELPEVEAVRSSLEPLICGQKITKVNVYQESVIAPLAAGDFCHALENSVVSAVERRGKYLLISIARPNQKDNILMVHLRMTGQLVCEGAEQPLKKHTHVVMTLGNGKEIRFTDVRRFGKMAILPEGNLSSEGGIAKVRPGMNPI